MFDLAENDKRYFVSRSTPEQLEYEEDYWRVSTDPDCVARYMSSNTERENKRELAKDELAFINASGFGRVLDLGCGVGALIENIRAQELHGLEISTIGAAESSKFAKIHHGDLASANYPDEYFDCVLMFHVIEHMQDPIGEMRHVRRILKNGGDLIVSCPDFDCACARRYGERYRHLSDPSHISLFSDKSLSRMLEDFGFSVERTEYPFFETKYFTEENLLRLLDESNVSPPFYGNILTKYCKKLSTDDAIIRLEQRKKAMAELLRSC